VKKDEANGDFLQVSLRVYKDYLEESNHDRGKNVAKRSDEAMDIKRIQAGSFVRL